MVGEILEKVVDELIALIIVLATVIYIGFGVQLPDWWEGILGVVIAYYFTRKVVKEQRQQ